MCAYCHNKATHSWMIEGSDGVLLVCDRHNELVRTNWGRH